VPGVDAFEVSSDLCAVLFGEANPSDGYAIRCFKVSINKSGEEGSGGTGVSAELADVFYAHYDAHFGQHDTRRPGFHGN
jgi:hypothetical protein